MDPDEALKRLRELTQNVLRLAELGEDNAELGVELAEQVEALDEWISKGGFLPKAWQPNK